MLSARYERALADIGEETEVWEQLRLHLPTPATELRAQRDRLRLLRISVAAVVRGYNQVRPASARPCPLPSARSERSSAAMRHASHDSIEHKAGPGRLPLAADSQLCDPCSS